MEEKQNEENNPNNFEGKTPKSNIDTEDSRFSCNICLDNVRDPVVTLCGHLYCWPCLYRWLNIGNTTCPVCKAGVTRENVIPLYIRGSAEDPRLKTDIPNRPNAQRPTPGPSFTQQQQAFQQGFNSPLNGMVFTTGFGFFPSLFGLQFQTFVPPPQSHPNNDRGLTPEQIQQNEVSRMLIILGTLVLLFLLFC